jgi:hypothetical protein
MRNNETVLSTAPKSDLSTPTLQFFWGTFFQPNFTYIFPTYPAPFQKPSGVKRKAQGVTIKNLDRPSLGADFKSSRDAIAGMVTSKYPILLRHALRDYGGQVAPPFAKASAGKLACGITQPSAGKHSVKILP